MKIARRSFGLLPCLAVVLTGCSKNPPAPQPEAPPAVAIAPDAAPSAPPTPAPTPAADKPAPAAVAEARKWMKLADEATRRQFNRRLIRERISAPFFFAVPAVGGTTSHHTAMLGARFVVALPFGPNEATDPAALADADVMRGAPLEAIRAARRAIAESPEHPEAYAVLADVYRNVDLPLSEAERTLCAITACRQYLARIPPPDRFKRGKDQADPVDVAFLLANCYLGQPIPGTPDAKTGQQSPLGFLGMPADVAPFNLLGDAVFLTDQGALVRVPFAQVAVGRVPPGARPLTGSRPYLLSLDAGRDAVKSALEYATAEETVSPSEANKKRVENIGKLQREVETAMIRARDQYDQVKSRPLPQVVQVTTHTGLTEEALKRLSDKEAVARDYKGGSDQEAALLRVILELALGRIEDASASLTALSTPEQAAATERARLTLFVQSLKYQKAVLAGEYKTAGELWEALGKPSLIMEQLMAGIAKNKISPNEGLFAIFTDWPLLPATAGTTALNELTLSDRAWRAIYAREQIVEQMRNEAAYYYRRGVLALLEGDIPAAKKQFAETTRKAPPGWNLTDFVHADAQQYLRMIERAEKHATP